MANKREFKKFVTAVGAGVAEDMLVNYHCNPGMDKAKVDECIGRVLLAVTKAVSDANVFFDKGARAFENKKEYIKAKEEFFKQLFKKINSEFVAELDGALKEYNSAVPADVKARNKENA